MSSSKSVSKNKLIKLVKIENIVTGNEYDKIFNIYLLILKYTDDNSKLEYFLVNRNCYKLKQLIIGEFYKLTEENQKKVMKKIFEMNAIKTREELMEGILELLKKHKCFNKFILMKIYIYLLIKNTELLGKDLDYKPKNISYAFLSYVNYMNFEKPIPTKEELLIKIRKILIEFIENENIDIDDYKNETDSDVFIYFEETLYKCKSYIYLISKEFTNKPNENDMFSYIFTNIELFFAADPEFRLINYYIMMNQSQIDKKISKLFNLILPPVNTSSKNTSIKEKLSHLNHLHSNNYYYTKVAFDPIMGIGSIRELNKKNLENIKMAFMKYIKHFYVESLLLKKYNKISRPHETIIKKILTIIMTVFKDEAYTTEKYQEDFKYIEDNKLIPNFYYYFIISKIMTANLKNPKIFEFFDDFIRTNINSIDEKQLKLSFPLTSATTREEFTRELAQPPANMERTTLSEDEEINLREEYINEYIERFQDNLEEVRLIFLGLIKNIYKKESNHIANQYIFENVLVPLFSAELKEDSDNEEEKEEEET